MGTPVSLKATVCYEGEGIHYSLFKYIKIHENLFHSGILVIQVQRRGKTFVGTLLKSENKNR